MREHQQKICTYRQNDSLKLDWLSKNFLIDGKSEEEKETGWFLWNFINCVTRKQRKGPGFKMIRETATIICKSF